jgi:uncharacterized membrane protein YdbT with pleckstrin-like domain
MNDRTLKPSPRYLHKLYLNISLIAVAIGGAGALMGLLISIDDGASAGAGVALVFFILNLVWWIPAMMLVGPYYRSLRYEIQEDEVIVHVGIWTKSVKHVPFRTVTNIVTNRDIFDRWFFNVGSLNIQTAGMSGAKGAEEKLVGLPNVQEVYDVVAGELRRFRGGMSPTAADVDTKPAGDNAGVMNAMLDELRSIRKALDK